MHQHCSRQDGEACQIPSRPMDDYKPRGHNIRKGGGLQTLVRGLLLHCRSDLAEIPDELKIKMLRFSPIDLLPTMPAWCCMPPHVGEKLLNDFVDRLMALPAVDVLDALVFKTHNKPRAQCTEQEVFRAFETFAMMVMCIVYWGSLL